MIKLTLIFATLLTAYSCAPGPKTSEFSDDYVLVEFAARLEEDYQKLYPQPLDEKTPEPSE